MAGKGRDGFLEMEKMGQGQSEAQIPLGTSHCIGCAGKYILFFREAVRELLLNPLIFRESACRGVWLGSDNTSC